MEVGKLAKISVTTDDGELMEVWSDAEASIGLVDGQLNALCLMQEIAREIKIARKRENRGDDGEKL